MLNASRTTVAHEQIQLRVIQWYKDWTICGLTILKGTPFWNFAALHAFTSAYSTRCGKNRPYMDCLDRDRADRHLWNYDTMRMLR